MPKARVNLIGEVDNKTRVRVVVDGKVKLYNTPVIRSCYIAMPSEPGNHTFSIFETDLIFGEYKTRNVANINVNLDPGSVLTINIFVDTTFGVTQATHTVKKQSEIADDYKYISDSPSGFKSFLGNLWDGAKFLLKIFVGVILCLLLIALIGMGCEHFG